MDRYANGSLKIGKWGCLFLIAVLLAACSAAGEEMTPTATSTATALFEIPPTPALELAAAYIPGQNDIPAGKYLAVESWSNSDGRSQTGICPYAAMMDMPMYGMNSTKLESFVQPEWDYSADEPDFSKAVGFFGMGSSNSGDMGGGASSRLTVIQSLPTSGEHSIFVIQSAAADGTIVVQIGGQAYRFKPGQSWVQNTESQPDENCHLLDTSRFTNYGLLDGSQITLGGTPLASP
jgi:hypothetical protein